MPVYSDGTYIGMGDSTRAQGDYAPAINTRFQSGSHGTTPDYAASQLPGPKAIYTEADISALYGASRQQVTAQQMLLYNMGYLTSSSDFKIGTMTESMEDELRAAMGDANRGGMTLGELYDRIRSGVMKGPGDPFGGSSGSGAEAPYTGPTTTTSTSSTDQMSENISLTGRGTARSLMVQALSEEIGREPTGKEIGRFMRALNKEQRQNPATSHTTGSTTTTTTSDPDPKSHHTEVSSSTSGTSQTVTKESNVDPANEADKFAEHVAPKEESRFEGAGYMNVIAQMLGM